MIIISMIINIIIIMIIILIMIMLVPMIRIIVTSLPKTQYIEKCCLVTSTCVKSPLPLRKAVGREV